MHIFRHSTAQVKVHQNSSCHFSNKKSVFLQSLDLFQCHERYFFCTFQGETLCAIGKSSTSKSKFPNLPLLALKFTKFLMPFLVPRVSISSNFASLFSVTRHHISVLFHLNICMLWTNRSNQSVDFWTFNWSHQN